MMTEKNQCSRRMWTQKMVLRESFLMSLKPESVGRRQTSLQNTKGHLAHVVVTVTMYLTQKSQFWRYRNSLPTKYLSQEIRPRLEMKQRKSGLRVSSDSPGTSLPISGQSCGMKKGEESIIRALNNNSDYEGKHTVGFCWLSLRYTR